MATEAKLRAGSYGDVSKLPPFGYYGWRGIAELLKEKKKRSGCGKESNSWLRCGLPTPSLSKTVDWKSSRTIGEL